MITLFIIAYHDGGDVTIETFRSAHKATKLISEIVADDYGVKAEPEESPSDYLKGYYDWVRDDNDNECDTFISLKIVELNP